MPRPCAGRNGRSGVSCERHGVLRLQPSSAPNSPAKGTRRAEAIAIWQDAGGYLVRDEILRKSNRWKPEQGQISDCCELSSMLFDGHLKPNLQHTLFHSRFLIDDIFDRKCKRVCGREEHSREERMLRTLKTDLFLFLLFAGMAIIPFVKERYYSISPSEKGSAAAWRTRIDIRVTMVCSPMAFGTNGSITANDVPVSWGPPARFPFSFNELEFRYGAGT